MNILISIEKSDSMFIYNFKINGTKLFKVFFIFIIVFVLIVLGFVVYKILNGSSENFFVQDEIAQDDIQQIDDKNFTNALKCVHDNVDNYIGKKISTIGYIYRVNDLNKNQFIIARNMLISNNSQYLIVGFLCEYNEADSLENNSWFEITGEIHKGSYHGMDMPIIEITNIIKTNKPESEYVSQPDDNFIPTSSII